MTSGSASRTPTSLEKMARQIVQSIIGVMPPDQAVSAVADNIMQLYDKGLGMAEAIAPCPKPLACGPGCAACCHADPITINGLEALRLILHLRRTLDDAGRARIKARLRNLDQSAAAMRASERPNPPCPLLGEDGRCMTYGIRPLVCRTRNSTDAKPCEDAWLHPTRRVARETYDVPDQIARAVVAGLVAGLAARGVTLSDVGLDRALALGLDAPDICERWLAGEAVFSTP